MDDFSSNDAFSNKSIRPLALVSQLLPLVANMHHIDELFAWLAAIMVERFGVVSAQVWAIQAYSTQMLRSKLRASNSQRPFQALQIVESAEVRVFVERMLRDQRGLLAFPVDRMFSPYQSTVFAQQGCLYWTAYFFSKDVLLQPSQENFDRGEVATPLRMIFSIFTQYPLQASDIRAISFLLEQSLRIAISQGLVSKTSGKSEKVDLSVLDHLVPEHIKMPQIEQAENPFNNAVVIADRGSREIYRLIDGKKNMSELASLMGASRQEIVVLLQSLFAKGYIRVREAGGNSVDISAFS